MALSASIEPHLRNVRLIYDVPATAATVQVFRTSPSGAAVDVRGWSATPVTGGSTVTIRDYEAPLDVPLVYTAQPKTSGGGTLTPATATITVASQGCDDTWLNDLARSQNTMQVVIESLPELGYDVPTTVHEILTRRSPIVSSDVAHTPDFELALLTETLDERDRARATLGNGIPVLLRTPPELGIGNLYLSVLHFAEQRIQADGESPVRRFAISGRQVDRPKPSLYQPKPPTTYNEVRARFATYADMRAQRANYDAVLYDWTGEQPVDVVPWPPDDV